MRSGLEGTARKATVLGMMVGCLVQPALAQVVEDQGGAEVAEGAPLVLDTVVIQAGGLPAAETGYVAPTSINRIETEPLEVPQTVTAITAKRIEDQDIRSNLDLLDASPGVDVVSNEGFTYIRGYWADTAIEGTPVDTFAGRTAVDLSAFEQVEILKGPAAIFSGTGSFGGMVNYSFKKPTDREALHTKVGFGHPSAKSLMVDYNLAPALDGRLRSRLVGSWEDRDMDAYPEGYKRAVFYGVTEFDLTDRTTLRFSAWRQRNDTVQGFRTGLPTWSDGTLIDFPAGTTATQDWALYRFRSTWLSAEVEHRFNDRWKLKLSFRDGDSHHPAIRNVGGLCEGPLSVHNYEDTGIDRDNPDGRNCYRLSYWNDWNQHQIYDATLTGAFDAMGRTHDVMLGFTHRRSWWRRAFGAPTDPGSEFVVDIFNPDPHVIDRPDWSINQPWGDKPTPTNDYQLFGQVNIQATERLTLPIGGRLSWVRSSDGEWTAKHEFTPSFAAIYKLNDDVMIYGQFSRMFAVNTSDRGWNPAWAEGDAHPYDDGVLLPNVTGTQKEIGVKANVFGGGALATASIFEIKEQNRARSDPNRAHVSEEGDAFMIPSGETRSRGLELGLNGEVRPGWEVGIGYAFIDAKYTRDDYAQGARLGTARHSGNIWTKYSFPEGRWDGVSLGFGVRFKGPFMGDETDSHDTNRVKAPGYAIASARIGYEINENFSAALNVDNLFDKRHYTVVSAPGWENYLGEMRRISFNLSSRF